MENLRWKEWKKKDKIGENCSDIAEDNHAFQSVINSNFREGD